MSGTEAVVTFALVCNVMQMIELGFKAASISKTIYETGSSDPEQNKAIEQLHGFLKSVQNSLGTVGQSQKPTEDEKRIAQISKNALTTVEQLKDILEKPAAAQGRKLDSLKWGLRRVLKKGDVDKLDKRLQKQKAALDTGLLSRICTQNDAHEIQMSTEFGNLTGALQAFVNEFSKRQTGWESLVQAVSDGQSDLRQLVQTTATETQTQVMQRVDELDLSLVDQARHERILKSLKVQKLNSRRNQIERPHASTFAWIFQPDLSDQQRMYAEPPSPMQPNAFLRWCQDVTAKVFWIEGKPGSGKSTLMKYLVDSRDTQRVLNSASPNTLVLSHFLWGGGTSEERSVKTLLCSLLHQILSSKSSLIPVISTKYPSHKDEPDDWSPEELQDTILESVNTMEQPVCIFIDGLDEIGEDGPDKLLTLIDVLLDNRHIRLCVSSRPEPAFYDRFGQGNIPSLPIRDFTWKDIRSLAEDNITSLLGYRPFHTTLSDAVCEKASGVFLCCSLALKAIRHGAVRGDDERELMRRLEALPSDLEKVYQQMWDRENGDNDSYREVAALWLNLMLEGEEVVPGQKLLVSHFLLVHKTEYLDRILNSSAPLDQIAAISLELPEAKRQLEIRCAGLLEVREDERTGHLCVSFIHKSAKKFLMNSKKSILDFDQTTPDFRNFALLKSSIVIPGEYHRKMYHATHLAKPRFNMIMPEYESYCHHLHTLKQIGLLHGQSTIELFRYTKKMYDHTEQVHLHCDFVALAASLAMWEYIHAVMESFRANAPDVKVSTAYSNYLFSASFGIPGTTWGSQIYSSEDRMKVARRMLENGINVRRKCVGSRYFPKHSYWGEGKPRLAVIASPRILATIRLIHQDQCAGVMHPALEVLASIVRGGDGLDERTVIKLVWEDKKDEFSVVTLDSPDEFLYWSFHGYCLVEVDTIYLLRLLVRVVTSAADYKESVAAEQPLMSARTAELKKKNRGAKKQIGVSRERHGSEKDETVELGPVNGEKAAAEADKLGTIELNASELRGYDDTAGGVSSAYEVEAGRDDTQPKPERLHSAAPQAVRNLVDAIQQGSGGLPPFCSLIAVVLTNEGKLNLATLPARDRGYLNEGLQQAYPMRSAFDGDGIKTFAFPLLRTRLQEVMGRVKWEQIEEMEMNERLKLVEDGYCVHVDDDICNVPKPF